jgi:hypothetical protein
VIEKKFALAALALALAAPGLQAAEGQATANPVDPESIAALKRMGTYLQTLQRFELKSERTSEIVLSDGQKLQRSAEAQVQVRRPDKLRLTSWRDNRQKDLIYDGKTVTLYTSAHKYYASTETADTIGGMVRQMQDKFGIDTPVSDLFVWGTDAAPLDKITSAMNAGQELVGGKVCNHYAFRQEEIDWQLWIRDGDQPLPCKVVITDRSDEARPQSESVLTWNLKPNFKDAVFKFTPPKGAMRITMRPLDTK